jgi:Cof subfamily protein (haloacid dehalogenase superfamily)
MSRRPSSAERRRVSERQFRLVAVDLDGTLLRSDSSVSQRTRDAVDAACAAGATVVIVTARSPRSISDLAGEAGIRGRAICANGATIFDLDEGKIVRHTALPAAVGHRIAVALRAELPDIVFGWELELRFGSEPGYEARRETHWWPRPAGSFAPCDVLDWSRPFTKLLARAEGAEQEHALAVARDAARGDASVTLAGQAFVEVMAAGITKGTALEQLASEAGIGRSEVVAFGDHITDIEMLEWAGLGVAVANAHPSVLAAADEITAANDEDGVAVMLERLAYPDSR